MPTNNPSVHYLGVYGIAANSDHARCHAQWERIKAADANIYGPNGAYNQGGCIHGQEFEGRGDDVNGAANGQQNGVDYNPGSRSICVMVGTDDDIPQACIDMVRRWYERQLENGKYSPLKSHSDFVATNCCGDPLRVTVWLINAFPSGAPSSSPSIKKTVGFDMIYIGNDLGGVPFCVSWNGSYIDRRFNGPPVAPFGVPQDAMEYSAGQIPIRLASWVDIAQMEKATALATT